MRQYLKFHSRDLVNVSPPKVRYFLSSPREFDVGSSVDGARNLVGMWGAIECGRGNRNRRSRRSLLNNAIR